MSFSKMMELLQRKNKGKVVMCNAGNFYIAIGKDAVLLNKLLDLKVTCFKTEVCKVGFPIESLEKYVGLIHEKKYGYVVYYFNQEKEELEVLLEYAGKKKNEEIIENVNCYICKHSTKYYRKEDKYIKAVSKLYEEEIENKGKITKKPENINGKGYKRICQINKNKKIN